MRKKFVIVAILFQVMVLAVMALEREYIAQTGTEIYLRTAPIDPRDIFRGDYVRLRYEISNISLRNARGSLADKEIEKPKDYKVYTVVTPDEDGVAELQHITDIKPAEGLFIRGRLRSRWFPRYTAYSAYNIQYGLEAYFVEQGQGLEMERKRGERTGVQVPLEMKVAIGDNGTAVLKGHRWGKLGVGLQVLRPGRQQNQQETNISSKLLLTLQNVSEEKLAIINLPNTCSFSLEPISQINDSLPLASDPCQQIQVSKNTVIVLNPDEKKDWEIDLSEPRWRVIHNNKPTATGDLPWQYRFRLVYHPPSREAVSHLSNRELVWHGSLPSRAFHGRGRVD